MSRFLFTFTLISSIIGGLIAAVGLVFAKGSPQEAAAASMGMAFAVIPYVFARCVQIVGDQKQADIHVERLVSVIRELKPEETKPTPLYRGNA